MLPTLAGAFSQVDDFVSSAMSVINRRKNRAGRALELHLATVFQEEGVSFQAQVMTETGSKVDFLFPSLDRYQGATSAASDIHMLAVKTTLKDRWRQVLQEGKKVSPKHLFTLDEGVSLATYQDMKSRDLQLVVPQRKVAHFPEPVRQDILTLRTFIELVKGAAA
ncbi:MAG: type II restriction endonuclease [Chloroflexota bacterium]|nr:type II restriction endonuclease [Chloroflexota bacterium]